MWKMDKSLEPFLKSHLKFRSHRCRFYLYFFYSNASFITLVQTFSHFNLFHVFHFNSFYHLLMPRKHVASN